MPEASEEEWQRRLAKRREAVAHIKRTPEYRFWLQQAQSKTGIVEILFGFFARMCTSSLRPQDHVSIGYVHRYDVCTHSMSS